ncbi:MAG: D-alanine--D-alanine ligase [Proteobacteria bacterium]|nr:D-alanine--D-alanine ligase [Pseudomonadota bacterium]
MAERLKIAVLLGGMSAEHDVSVLTGLQVLEALDPQKYEGFPVYIGLDGQWWVGEALRQRKNYLPDLAVKRGLMRVQFGVGNSRGKGGKWVLRGVDGGMFGGGKEIDFDVVIPALHGTWGEDGILQGVMAAEGVPLVGGGVGAMAVCMNKAWAMQMARALEIPVLPSLVVQRGDVLEGKEAVRRLGKYPLFVKPNFLGSSLGAKVVKDDEELQASLSEVFRLDFTALVQPCVRNLVEFNVAVRRSAAGKIVTSAIERPLTSGETLDFKDKYLSGGGLDKLGGKLGPAQGEGMASLTRELHPKSLPAKKAAELRGWAAALFELLDLGGAPRLDFFGDSKTGEIWFNEINPLPGSFGYFLWEAAEPRIGFSDLLDEMIEEARGRARSRSRVIDPTNGGGGIFRRRG